MAWLSSRRIVTCLVFFFLSCLGLSCPVLPGLKVSCRVVSCRALFCFVLNFLSWLVLSCLVLSYLVLSYLILSCLALPYDVLSCLVLSCLEGEQRLILSVDGKPDHPQPVLCFLGFGPNPDPNPNPYLNRLFLAFAFALNIFFCGDECLLPRNAYDGSGQRFFCP
jgi:hypothetical protein